MEFSLIKNMWHASDIIASLTYPCGIEKTSISGYLIFRINVSFTV